MLVPRVHTPVPLAGLDNLLDAAHRDVRGFGLSEDAYRLAIAQLKLEHGTDGAGNLRGVYGYCLGNHDATHADRANPTIPIFSTVPEHEGNASSSDTAVHLRRAYEDAEAGLMGYWAALLDGFPDGYDAICTGDPAVFAHALKVAHYYTADEASYARGLRALMPAVEQ